jgi:hypothetical protein
MAAFRDKKDDILVNDCSGAAVQAVGGTDRKSRAAAAGQQMRKALGNRMRCSFAGYQNTPPAVQHKLDNSCQVFVQLSC